MHAPSGRRGLSHISPSLVPLTGRCCASAPVCTSVYSPSFASALLAEDLGVGPAGLDRRRGSSFISERGFEQSDEGGWIQLPCRIDEAQMQNIDRIERSGLVCSTSHI